jgi:2-oxoglutarate ferredoxin oxidoreductase subunit delta
LLKSWGKYQEDVMTGKSPMEETVVTNYGKRKINVISRYCKGCEICVVLCPADVLDMKEFKVNVDCTECMLCELRCPDFAIEVVESGKKGRAK